MHRSGKLGPRCGRGTWSARHRVGHCAVNQMPDRFPAPGTPPQQGLWPGSLPVPRCAALRTQEGLSPGAQRQNDLQPWRRSIGMPGQSAVRPIRAVRKALSR